MPIPKPSGTQSKEEFIQACMGDDIMVKEYPDQKQRYAICNGQWSKKNVKAEVVNDEVIISIKQSNKDND